MKRIRYFMLLLCVVASAPAQDLDPVANFFSDGWSFVPPACTPQAFGPAGTVVGTQVNLPETAVPGVDIVPVEIRAWRIACPGGATVIAMDLRDLSGLAGVSLGVDDLEISTAAGTGGEGTLTLAPDAITGHAFPTEAVRYAWANIAAVSPPFLLTRNTYQSIVDNNPQMPPVTVDDMQSEVTIGFFRGGSLLATITVPAAEQMTATPFFDQPPLTGRYSGNWQVEGSADQGILLSISELPDGRLVAFMAWFTFDSDGQATWFTGNNFFEAGDNSVGFDLVTVDGGSFNQPGDADRESVGTATLSVIDCAGLELEFDLVEPGLGADTVTLRRLLAGEIAGYTCRDLHSRQQ